MGQRAHGAESPWGLKPEIFGRPSPKISDFENPSDSDSACYTVYTVKNRVSIFQKNYRIYRKIFSINFSKNWAFIL
jgi:hypothetical protein